MVRAENQCSDSDAIRRAKWEASTRAARAVTVSVTLAGWRQDNNELWEVNTLVECDIPYLKIKQNLIVYKVVFSLTLDGGTTTQLTLKDPKAFEPEPPKKKSGPGAGGKSAASAQGETGGNDLQQESADRAWTAQRELANG